MSDDAKTIGNNAKLEDIAKMTINIWFGCQNLNPISILFQMCYNSHINEEVRMIWLLKQMITSRLR